MTSREELIEEARVAFVDAWEAERKKIGRGIAKPGTKTRAGIVAALAVFEQAHEGEVKRAQASAYDEGYDEHADDVGLSQMMRDMGGSNGNPYIEQGGAGA